MGDGAECAGLGWGRGPIFLCTAGGWVIRAPPTPGHRGTESAGQECQPVSPPLPPVVLGDLRALAGTLGGRIPFLHHASNSTRLTSRKDRATMRAAWNGCKRPLGWVALGALGEGETGNAKFDSDSPTVWRQVDRCGVVDQRWSRVQRSALCARCAAASIGAGSG